MKTVTHPIIEQNTAIIRMINIYLSTAVPQPRKFSPRITALSQGFSTLINES